MIDKSHIPQPGHEESTSIINRKDFNFSGVWFPDVSFFGKDLGVATFPDARFLEEPKIGHPIEWRCALTYSLAVMSLQKPEPKPVTGTAQTLVLLETILGPVRAARARHSTQVHALNRISYTPLVRSSFKRLI